MLATALLAANAAVALPTRSDVRAALQQQIAEESLASGGVPGLENMPKARVRGASCVATSVGRVRCNVDQNGCEPAEDADHDGWCVRPVDLTYGERTFLFQSEVMWFVTANGR